MWDLPGPGLEPVSPALAGGFLTTAPPGKPLNLVWIYLTLAQILLTNLIFYFCNVNLLFLLIGSHCPSKMTLYPFVHALPFRMSFPFSSDLSTISKLSLLALIMLLSLDSSSSALLSTSFFRPIDTLLYDCVHNSCFPNEIASPWRALMYLVCYLWTIYKLWA